MDAQDRTARIAGTFVTGSIAGLLFGLAGVSLLVSLPVAYLVGYGMMRYAVPGFATVLAGWIQPSGRSTPPKRAYSVPESMIQQGRYEDAVGWFEDALAEVPDDPEPAVRLGHLYRDLQRYEQSILWLRTARRVGRDNAFETQMTREIVELLLTRLNTPSETVSELARLRDNATHGATKEWAVAELRRIRIMTERQAGDE